MKILSLTFALVLFSSSLGAKEFSTRHFEVALGGQISSLLYKRGLITYEGYQAVPVFAVQLFHPQLLWAGSSLYYTHSLLKNTDLRLRLHFDSTKDKPLYYTAEDKEDRIRRESTSEFEAYLEQHWSKGLFRLQLSQDLVAHKGRYAELHTRLHLMDLIVGGDNRKPLIQPAVFAGIGGGDLDHNTYLYGPGAADWSLTNVEYGFLVASPRVIDPYWPTFKLTWFEILGENNRSAAYVQEKDGWQAELLFAFRVW